MTVSVFTLGCKVNQYESDLIAQELEKRGHKVFRGLEKADIYVVNTCAVTGEAERKSRQAISRCLAQNPEAKIVIVGCASEASPKAFENKNVIIGTGSACSSRKGTANRVLEAMRKSKSQNQGAIRISFSSENTLKDIKNACNIILNSYKELLNKVS